MISFGEIVSQGKYMIDQNSTGILTGIGVVGTISTAILSARATFKAAEIIRKEELTLRMDPETPEHEAELTSKQKLAVIWPQYIVPIGVGSMTILAIIMANRLAAKEATALAAAYTLSERTFSEYKEKVVQRLGENKELAIRDEMAQDRVRKEPPSSQGIAIVDNGDVLFMDGFSGRYFRSTMQKVQQAENAINHKLINHDYASLSEFYEYIGLEPTDMSDLVGWTVNTLLEIKFHATITEDQKPCMVLSFQNPPFTDYGKPLYS